MNPKKPSLGKHETENKDEAELVAILSNRIPFYDKREGAYKILSKEDAQSIISDLYDEDRYTEAEDLIDSYDRFSKLNPDKELGMVKSKSFRLSKVQFVKAVKKAYERNVSVADVLRFNIAKKTKSFLKDLYQYKEFDDEGVKLLEKEIEKWSDREGRSPLQEGYQLSFDLPTSSSKEKYERFGRYFVRKTILENKIKDEKLVDIFENYFKIADPGDLWGSSKIKINKNDGNLNLVFQYSVNIFLDCYDMDTLDSLLSDIANQDYSNKELKDLPIFNKFQELPHIVQSISKGKYDKLEYSDILDQEVVWEDIQSELSFPELKIKIPLKIKNKSLRFGKNLSENGDFKEIILDKILDSELKSLDIDDAKQQVRECLEKGDTSSAKKINRQISIYNSVEYIAEIIENMILDSLSTQIVSLTMPKGVSGLIKMIDLKKEDMIG